MTQVNKSELVPNHLTQQRQHRSFKSRVVRHPIQKYLIQFLITVVNGARPLRCPLLDLIELFV